MSVVVYGIKNCDSVKKALRFLESHNIDYSFHDFKSDPVDRITVAAWSAKAGWKTLMNSKGTTYRTLGLKQINPDEDQAIDWMSRYNLLIKRPVIETDERLIIGFDPSQYEGIFYT